VTRTRSLALVVACALALAACSGSSSTSAQKESNSRPEAGSNTGSTRKPDGSTGTLTWNKCKDKAAAMAGLDCAPLEVPIDPKVPKGPTTTIALAKSSSTGSADERIGSLVINPGGPGGSGIEFLSNAASMFPKDLTDHFDLVSFDPRGVGDSDPVRCLNDEQKDEQLQRDLSPTDDAERAQLEKDQVTLRKGCESRNPELVHHMSTADVASDLDQIRQALGDQKLNFLGYSYGTAIGATYAAMFPTTIRAMVLDGSVSPSATAAEETMAQAMGFERTLKNFITACNADTTCALAPDTAGAIDAARASLQKEPVKVATASGERTLTADLFDYGLATALYDTSTWAPTAQAIKNIRTTGAKTILSLVDRQTGRQTNGTYDNSSDAQVMVNCSDQQDRPTEAEARADEAKIVAAAPTFGPILGSGLTGCNDWPKPSEPTPKPSAQGAPPIMVIGTVGDPATPYEWAQQMSTALTGSVLLTYEGDGHTAFLRGGKCIEDAVVNYFVDLTLPAPGTRCPAESTGDEFSGVKGQLIKQLVDSGLDEKTADCIVNGMVKRVGESEFDDMVLQNDADQITKLAQATALECMTSGGG
jgi:pimeloyl-ACP methyl ester carboxylesterase